MDVQRTLLLHFTDQFLIYQKSNGNSSGTRRFYRQKLDLFIKFAEQLEIRRVEDITTPLVREYLVWLEETGHNPGGRHAAYRALKAFVYWYEADYDPEGWTNPIRHKVKAPKVPEQILDPLEDDVIDRLLRTCRKDTVFGLRDRAILLTLKSTGARASEVSGMDIQDITWPLRKVLIRHGKGDKPRPGFFDRDTQQALNAYLKARGSPESGPLFLSRYNDRISYDGLRAMLERRIEDAGLPKEGVTLHAFRRTFGITRIRADAGERATADLLGHTTTAIVHKYAKQNEKDLKRAHDRQAAD